MKSITMVPCRMRAWASAVIRSIWWLLPSTRATQVRSWFGSRRSGLGGRGRRSRAQRVGTHHDTLAVAGQHEWVTAGAGRGLPLAVEAVRVARGSAGELFDLPLADLLSGAPFDRLDRPVERTACALDGRETT